jgi:eukaryotic-like serine/threonine-protein kinase
VTELLTGRVLNDRYKITERIGIGGMAEVYRAQDTVLGRTVAIKIMLPQFAENTTFTQKFKQEAASAANLNSPYIVNIYDWGQDNGTYYIVMEYVRGTDLKSGIQARGALNQRKVAEIGSQVCQALTVAHKMDIIHCDIKPQNIMIQPDGNVKVMDFGISKAKNSLEAQSSTVLGTAHYISPEQAQGKELTAASDIYSLGVVLYEAATGKLPFDGPDAVSVATMQVKNEAPLPGDVNSNIDPRLETIIVRAMQKDPRKRYASAAEMRAALNEFLAGRKAGATTVIGSGVSAAETTVIGAGGAAAGAGAAAPGMTAVLPAGSRNGGAHSRTGNQSMQTKYRSTREEDEEIAAQKEVTRRTAIIAGVVALIIVVVAAVFLVRGCSANSDAEMAEVPDVTGMTAAQATSVLKEAGFELGAIDKSYNNTGVESGTVISQDPAGGKSSAKGSKVNLVVSLGAEEVVVPDLKGKTAKEAQDALSELGLTAQSGTAQYSSEVEVNKVMSQSPAAGETVKKGSSVEYVLSLGEENIQVPDVTGKSKSSATSELESLGFSVSVKTSYSDSVSEGNVISQSPSGGKLEKGGTVTITVSEGEDPSKAQVSIPNVEGYTISEAKHALESAGFSVSVSGASSENALVVSYSPTGSAQKGSTITITCKDPEPQGGGE